MNDEEISGKLKQFTESKILVVGDLMIDVYIWGNVERISPEAPVQIVDVEFEETRLGGAGNVIKNLTNLGAQVFAASIIDQSGTGNEILHKLQELKVDCEGIIREKNRHSSRKTRIICAENNQQMLRIDKETRSPINSSSETAIYDFTKKNIKDFDAIILSDYNKGVLTKNVLNLLIELAQNENKPILVDPKGKDFSKYRGATIITPNRKETELVTHSELSNEETIRETGITLQKNLDLACLLITLGKDGMAFFKDGDFQIIRAEAKEVYDVSGAGDTVISILGAGISVGMPWIEAARLANLGAGIVVGKVGTEPVTLKEIETVLHNKQLNTFNKVVSLEEMGRIIKKLRKNKKTIIFTNGCFDILHMGHTDYLQKARNLGDVLILALNSDDSVRRLKGENRPIINQNQRAVVLSALSCVDYVIIFSEDTPINVIETLQPDVIVKGNDYTIDQVVGREIVESYGGRVELVELMKGISTSNIVEKIKNKNNSEKLNGSKYDSQARCQLW